MKLLRIIQGIVLLIIAANAFGGGFYGMAGAKDVPVEWLEGSPFKSYFIPSLFLFAVIGGTCLLASISMFRNSKNARRLSFICAGLLFGWIAVQVAIIGYVSWMQPAIFISAIAITTIAFQLPKKQTEHA
ncbi:MAG: hypothetical protein K0Q95_3369 [Bacteroidota bacterium]|nr:hypothetical protein [Bacteroidota bacterium]